MKILMVLTSHDQLGNTGRKTGFWLEEFAAPYFVFRDAGVELTLASPKGGEPPIDPKSDLPENQTPAMARFKKDAAAQKALAHTLKLADVKATDYDTVFYPGGHGPMWDLAESPESIALLESFYNSGKPIALVCHSPGVLRHVTHKGAPLVKGKHVTGFTDGEEEEVQLTKVVPFLVEDELLRLGAIYEKVRNWEPFSVVDGRKRKYLSSPAIWMAFGHPYFASYAQGNQNGAVWPYTHSVGDTIGYLFSPCVDGSC